MKQKFETKNVFFGCAVFFIPLALGIISSLYFKSIISYSILGVLSLFSIVSLWGFNIVNPKEEVVVQLFGKPKGSFSGDGIHWLFFWYNTIKISMADEKHESEPIKVNDENGTPVVVSITFTSRIVDSEKYIYNLDQEKEDYLDTTVLGFLRNGVRKYPYDSDKKAITLTNSDHEICEAIEKEINKESSKYGIEVDNLSFSELAYAPEIASIMLQKQQAQATIDAKSKLTKGLVDVVTSLVDKMEEDNKSDKIKGFKFTEEERSAFARDMMLIMVGNKEATPVFKVGSSEK